MKIGLLSDAHGNRPALEAALEALERQRVDQIFFLGDAVGYYPDVNEVVHLLRTHVHLAIRGNHDRLLLRDDPAAIEAWGRYRLQDARRRIEPQHLEWLRSLPDEASLDVAARRVALYHGSPWERDEYVYPDADFGQFSHVPADVILLGHTHVPFVRHVGDRLIVNPGSCGQPRDYRPGASAAVLDLETTSAVLLSVQYDIPKYIARLEAEDLPPSFVQILTRTPHGDAQQ